MKNVVIIGGNKRAGKTTLGLKLHNEYNYNYYNLDMLFDSLESAFDDLEEDERYIKLLENMVGFSLEHSKKYGIKTVYEYIFSPKDLKDFKYRDDVDIIFLANLDADENNIINDLKMYSNDYDWPSYATDEELKTNVDYILNKNNRLVDECEKYNFKLINTSRGEKRNLILNDIIK